MSGMIGPGRVEVPAESIGNRLSPGRPDANGKGDVWTIKKIVDWEEDVFLIKEPS